MSSDVLLDATRAYVQQRTFGGQAQQQSETLSQRQTPRNEAEEIQKASQRQNILRM